MSLCVIDGDIVGFKAAAACETRFIRAVHTESGKEKEFKHRTEFRSWLKTQDKWQEGDFTVIDDRQVEDIANCLHTIKVMVNNIFESSGCDDLKIVVQGDGNFRDELPLPTKYKGGRQDMIRPLHLKEAQSYLISKYKAERANGQEGDDILAAYAYEGFKSKKKIVQCTTDKDAKQCAGWLYNWDKMQEPIFIQGLGKLEINSKGKLDGYGRKWLYYQATCGDPSDSYNPAELAKAKYGEKSFYKDFTELETDKACWLKMEEIYKKWYPETFTYTAWDGVNHTVDHIDIMQIYMDCAHMRRWEGDQIDVRKVLSGYSE